MKQTLLSLVSVLISFGTFSQCRDEPGCKSLTIINNNVQSVSAEHSVHNCIKSIGSGTVNAFNWSGSGSISLEGKITINAPIIPAGRKIWVLENSRVTFSNLSLTTNDTVFVEYFMDAAITVTGNPVIALKNGTATCKVNGNTLGEGTHTVGAGSIKVINLGCNNILPIKLGSLSVTPDKDGYIVQFETLPVSETKFFNLWVTIGDKKRKIEVLVPEFEGQRKFKYFISKEKVKF